MATRHLPLVLGGGGEEEDPDTVRLPLYTDANWGKDTDAKSVTGLVMMLDGRARITPHDWSLCSKLNWSLC